MSQVYFLSDGDAIKIGHASGKLERRVSGIQTGHPGELVVLGAFPADIYGEMELHARFAHLRIRGEWFRSDPELLDFIASAKQSQCARHAILGELIDQATTRLEKWPALGHSVVMALAQKIRCELMAAKENPDDHKTRRKLARSIADLETQMDNAKRFMA